MDNPTLLSPSQFAALTAYVEATVELAVAKEDDKWSDSNSRMMVWRSQGVFQDARAAAEKALVAPNVEE